MNGLNNISFEKHFCDVIEKYNNYNGLQKASFQAKIKFNKEFKTEMFKYFQDNPFINNNKVLTYLYSSGNVEILKMLPKELFTNLQFNEKEKNVTPVLYLNFLMSNIAIKKHLKSNIVLVLKVGARAPGTTKDTLSSINQTYKTIFSQYQYSKKEFLKAVDSVADGMSLKRDKLENNLTKTKQICLLGLWLASARIKKDSIEDSSLTNLYDDVINKIGTINLRDYREVYAWDGVKRNLKITELALELFKIKHSEAQDFGLRIPLMTDEGFIKQMLSSKLLSKINNKKLFKDLFNQCAEFLEISKDKNGIIKSYIPSIAIENIMLGGNFQSKRFDLKPQWANEEKKQHKVKMSTNLNTLLFTEFIKEIHKRLNDPDNIEFHLLAKKPNIIKHLNTFIKRCYEITNIFKEQSFDDASLYLMRNLTTMNLFTSNLKNVVSHVEKINPHITQMNNMEIER